MATDQVSDNSFEADVINADGPVVVDFWAEWCGPCKMLAPTVDEVAESFAGRAKVGKLDTDANQKIAAGYGISAIPTLILFHNGEVKNTLVGLKSKADLVQAIEECLTAA